MGELGPRTVQRKAQEVAALPHVVARVEELQEQERQRCEVTVDDIFRRLRSLAFANITEFFDFDGRTSTPRDWRTLSPEQKACIKEILQYPNGEIAIKLHDSLRTAELLSKHLGLFRDEALEQTHIRYS